MKRFTWTDEHSKKMLIILNDEKNKGTSKFNWHSIAKVFNAQTRLDIKDKQASNHYSEMKEKFKTWEELQNLTGIAYDPRTKKVDTQEESLERYTAYLERNRKYGLKIIKDGLPNTDLLIQLFDGKTAHGVGGCFSPAMGKGSSYLTNNLDTLNIIDESSGDNEDEDDNDNPRLNVSGNESESPPRPITRKVAGKNSYKRKIEESSYSIENKRRQDSFDTVIKLLSSSVAGSSNAPSRAQLVNAELTRMEVAEKKGDEYFVQAIRYFSDDKHADNFLALQSDNQKWIYLKGVDSFYPIQ